MKKIYSILILFMLTISSCTNFDKDTNYWFKDNTYHWHNEIVWDRNVFSTVSKIKDKNTHEYSDWIINSHPTVEEEGSRCRKCKVCGYLDVEVLGKISTDNIHEFPHRNHGYNFFDYIDMTNFLNKKFNKYNNESFYLLKQDESTSFYEQYYKILYNDKIEGRYINPVFVNFFEIRDSKIIVRNPLKDTGAGENQSMYLSCFFYPCNNKEINFNNVNIIRKSIRSIQIKYDDFIVINVSFTYHYMLNKKNINYALDFIKNNLYKFN